MPARKIKTKSLFFTTSPRSPEKMIPEIKLLTETLDGSTWNHQTQKEFMLNLVKQDFYNSTSDLKNPDFSARDRINRAPKALGFVDLKPCIRLTEPGKSFAYGKRPEEIFLRQLLKFQIPSTFSPEHESIEGTFFVKPYLEIMRLISELHYLTFDELRIFGLRLVDYREFDGIKTEILFFRNVDKVKRKGEYKKLIDEKAEETIKIVYSSELEQNSLKTRESNDTSLKNFIKTKKKNMRDYSDACFRYLRFTELFIFTGRSISVSPDKLQDLQFILHSVDRNPVFIHDESKYKKYLYSPTVPELFSDNVDNLVSTVRVLTGQHDEILKSKTIEELKNVRDEKILSNRDEKLSNHISDLKSHALFESIIENYELLDDHYDRPLMLEYNTWQAMTMLNDGNIVGNFILDDNAQPKSTAPGNKADIECFYEDFSVTVEVTLTSGHSQFKAESESIARHRGDLSVKTGKETFCIFIAPRINDSNIAYFFALNQIKMKYYNGKSKIIPLELEQFKNLLKKSYKSSRRPMSSDVYSILNKIILAIDISEDELEWRNHINNSVLNWMGESEI